MLMWASYKVYDNIHRIMSIFRRESTMKYCNKCKRETSQRYSGRFRICTVCKRKVIVK